MFVASIQTPVARSRILSLATSPGTITSTVDTLDARTGPALPFLVLLFACVAYLRGPVKAAGDGDECKNWLAIAMRHRGRALTAAIAARAMAKGTVRA